MLTWVSMSKIGMNSLEWTNHKSIEKDQAIWNIYPIQLYIPSIFMKNNRNLSSLAFSRRTITPEIQFRYPTKSHSIQTSSGNSVLRTSMQAATMSLSSRSRSLRAQPVRWVTKTNIFSTCKTQDFSTHIHVGHRSIHYFWKDTSTILYNTDFHNPLPPSINSCKKKLCSLNDVVVIGGDGGGGG